MLSYVILCVMFNYDSKSSLQIGLPTVCDCYNRIVKIRNFDKNCVILKFFSLGLFCHYFVINCSFANILF